MKNSIYSLFFSLCAITLFIANDIRANGENNQEKRTQQNQPSLADTEKVFLTIHFKRIGSLVKILETDITALDCYDKDGNTALDLIKELLQQPETPLTQTPPPSPNQTGFGLCQRNFCCASHKAMHREELDELQRKREAKDKLTTLLNQKQRSHTTAKPSFDLSIDTETIKPTVSNANQRSCPVTPTSPNDFSSPKDLFPNVQCCMAFQATHKDRVEARKQKACTKRELAALPEAPSSFHD